MRLFSRFVDLSPATIELAAHGVKQTAARPVSVSAIPANFANPQVQFSQFGPDASKMDKIKRLQEILALDPKNSFARYGIAMELVKLGDTAAALAEFDILLSNDPDYTPGYFMAAQTLASAGKKSEAIERLKAGIGCAARAGNSHALSEMQTMLDELGR
jgi:predicted Zn-dependent protease